MIPQTKGYPFVIIKWGLGIGADPPLIPCLFFTIMFAMFQPETTVASFAPIDFLVQAFPDFDWGQGIGDGLPAE
jgi:hypothetical protein